jgi:hypothetical protein
MVCAMKWPRSVRAVQKAPSVAVLVSLLAAAAVASAPGCSSDSTDDTSGFTEAGAPPPSNADASDANGGAAIPGLVKITVTPGTAALTTGDQSTTKAFTASGTFVDGTTRDVTAQVVWNVYPPSLLTLTGTTVGASGAAGGDGTVSAVSGTLTGSAPVHVTYAKSVYANGAAPGAEGKFGGAATTSLNPALLYPLDGALFPPNLGPMEVQWTPAAGTSLFDVHVTGPAIDLHAYTGCSAIGAGCGLSLDASTWAVVVATLRGAAPAQVTIRATDGNGGGVGEAAPASVQLAATDVKGGLYYFNTHSVSLPDGGATLPGIYRYDFDSAQVGEFFTSGQCAGCHALSNDGTKMLAPICTTERGCGRPLQLAVVDVATKQFVSPPMPVGDTDTQAWTPDNKFYVTTPSCATIPANPGDNCNGNYSGGVINLIDATTNTFVSKVPTGPSAMFPHFSNDGKHLVYARGATYIAPLNLTAASLYTIDFDSTTKAWGTEKTLLASAGGENDYYPNYSSDDEWVLFTRSTCLPGEPQDRCDTYDDVGARAVVVPAAGGAAIDLAKANGAGRVDNSWSRWSPFNGTYAGGSILWFTFSTVRDYGLRAVADGAGAHVRQLWIVGFDVAKARAGQDPSFAPVWLPFQDVASSNHIGQWTSKVVGPIK